MRYHRHLMENKDMVVSRTKPWGTAHAILAAKPYINEPFIIINADDYYGADVLIRKQQNF